MNTVKIQSIDNTTSTRVYVGDSEVHRVKSIQFEQSVDTVPTFTFETNES